jgi:hypothetical protein
MGAAVLAAPNVNADPNDFAELAEESNVNGCAEPTSAPVGNPNAGVALTVEVPPVSDGNGLMIAEASVASDFNNMAELSADSDASRNVPPSRRTEHHPSTVAS